MYSVDNLTRKQFEEFQELWYNLPLIKDLYALLEGRFNDQNELDTIISYSWEDYRDPYDVEADSLQELAHEVLRMLTDRIHAKICNAFAIERSDIEREFRLYDCSRDEALSQVNLFYDLQMLARCVDDLVIKHTGA